MTSTSMTSCTQYCLVPPLTASPNHHPSVKICNMASGQPQDKCSTLARVERITLGKGITDTPHTSTLKRVKFVDQEMVREICIIFIWKE